MPATTSSQTVENTFSQQELTRIHHAACQYVAAVVHNSSCEIRELLGELSDRPIAGIYVTLKRGDTLYIGSPSSNLARTCATLASNNPWEERQGAWLFLSPPQSANHSG